MSRFLILQLRPEDEASDDEFAAFLAQGGLAEAETHRVRLDQARLPKNLRLDEYAGVIIGGGPGCVSDDPATRDPVEAQMEEDCLSLLPEIVARDMPFMGCCAGIGLLGHHLGAEVSKRRYSEPVGPVDCTVTEDGAKDPLLAGFETDFTALVGHKEALQDLPDGVHHLVASGPCPFQMIRLGENVYATQFHPEADGDVFAARIRIYRDRGYFPPEDAAALTEASRAAQVTVPPKILARFVDRYRTA